VLAGVAIIAISTSVLALAEWLDRARAIGRART
jgi:hypothetical protein